MAKHNVLLCDCGSSEHQVLIKHFEDEEDDFKEVYFDIHLVKRSFWYRVKYGLKYIFGYKSKYGAWDETILTEKHIPQLQAVIDYLKPSDGNKP